MSDLLPCPFCGSSDIDPEGWLNGLGERGPECLECGATGPTATRWNCRPASGGWQTVPIEADNSMMQAAAFMVGCDFSQDEIYDAMLAAAPKPGEKQ